MFLLQDVYRTEQKIGFKRLSFRKLADKRI